MISVPFLCAIVGVASGLDMRGTSEGACLQNVRTVKDVEPGWLIDSLPFISGGSKFQLYRLSSTLGRFRRLREFEFYDEACFVKNANFSEGKEVVLGFGGVVLGSYDVRGSEDLTATYDVIPNNEQTGGPGDVVTGRVTLTDYRTYAVLVNCWVGEGQQRSWMVVSLNPTVGRETERLIEDHVRSLGFDRDHVVFLRNRGCRRDGTSDQGGSQGGVVEGSGDKSEPGRGSQREIEQRREERRLAGLGTGGEEGGIEVSLGGNELGGGEGVGVVTEESLLGGNVRDLGDDKSVGVVTEESLLGGNGEGLGNDKSVGVITEESLLGGDIGGLGDDKNGSRQSQEVKDRGVEGERRDGESRPGDAVAVGDLETNQPEGGGNRELGDVNGGETSPELGEGGRSGERQGEGIGEPQGGRNQIGGSGERRSTGSSERQGGRSTERRNGGSSERQSGRSNERQSGGSGERQGGRSNERQRETQFRSRKPQRNYKGAELQINRTNDGRPGVVLSLGDILGRNRPSTAGRPKSGVPLQRFGDDEEYNSQERNTGSRQRQPESEVGSQEDHSSEEKEQKRLVIVVRPLDKLAGQRQGGSRETIGFKGTLIGNELNREVQGGNLFEEIHGFNSTRDSNPTLYSRDSERIKETGSQAVTEGIHEDHTEAYQPDEVTHWGGEVEADHHDHDDIDEPEVTTGYPTNPPYDTPTSYSDVSFPRAGRFGVGGRFGWTGL